MTKLEITESLRSLKDSIEDVVRSSPSILPEKPSMEEVSGYAAAMNSLSFALTDIDRAIVHIGEMNAAVPKGGDAGS